MPTQILLVTPPFTQLNTPYPATAYLKGFLNTKGYSSAQADLGLDVTLKLFSAAGLAPLFLLAKQHSNPSDNLQHILALQEEYLGTIDRVIAFLQDKDPTLAHVICSRNFLPEAARFAQTEDLEWAFGTMGTRDHARHLATLYLEDINDMIVEAIDPEFGFTRYAEHLGRCANSFDELHERLSGKPSYIDSITLQVLDEYIRIHQPQLLAFSVPFPGNLYSAFRCASHIRKNHPEIKTAMGGGFPNTELRSLSDPRVFDYFHFITLDDGEAPIESLLLHLNQQRSENQLRRTFLLRENKVEFINDTSISDYKQKDVGTPDYSGLRLKEYLSVIEIANPMHRLWSDGRWNKLTMAHGCYWGKCTFCDISLDYIKVYEFTTAKVLVDRMEELIEQTGETGFHFVDEAAPPALMRELALEILRRKLKLSWWTNIRFEKSFSRDLCRLLAASGCIAVSGGLEVASDRLLELIDKGVTVEQVTRVASHFTEAGIMVHAYLMYGYPTQTAQETIDSLEIVRQLFENGVLQSAFWHRFAMTAHSPVGMHPEQFGVTRKTELNGSFANNDLDFIDTTGCDHDAFAEGLRISLYNYMHGTGFDIPLQKWFEKKIPKTTHPRDHVEQILNHEEFREVAPHAKVIWLGGTTSVTHLGESGKRKENMNRLTVYHSKGRFDIDLPEKATDWLAKELLVPMQIRSFNSLRKEYEKSIDSSFMLLWHQSFMDELRNIGLLIV